MKLILIIIIIILTLFIFKKKNRINKINSKIPGPIGLPIIGNLHQLKNNPNKVFKKWYKKYGPIYRIRMGNIETIILTGYPIIKKSFIDNSNVFKKRYEYWSKIQFNNCSDLTFTNGGTHSNLKKIILSEMTLTKLKKQENYIILECEKLCKHLDNHCESGLPFKFKFYGKLFSLNIIFRFLFGLNYQYDNEKIIEIINLILELVEGAGYPIISDFIPIVKYFENINQNKFIKIYKKLIILIENIINDLKLKLTENNNLNQYDENNSTIFLKLFKEFKNGKITWDNLVGTCVDITVGGTDTVSDSLNFSLIALINNQNCQEKLYNEIKNELLKNNNLNNNNNNDLIILKHSLYRLSIPYLSMVMKETYRNFPVALLGLPIITTEDIEINGFKIAKGTQVFKNIFLSHKSKDFFKTPNDFNPERFSDSGNNFMFGGGTTNLVQFGAGSRDCIGKNVVDCELFIVLGTLINRYQFLNPIPSKPLNENGIIGLANQSPDNYFIIKKRKLN
ncbi:hypothetical protein ACTFIR_000729 [Dictyostelium discoideum]